MCHNNDIQEKFRSSHRLCVRVLTVREVKKKKVNLQLIFLGGDGFVILSNEI